MKIKAFVCMVLILVWFPPLKASAGAPAKDEVVFPNIPRIAAEELKMLIDKGADLVAVDVRDTASYEAGHIKGAVNIYYDATADPMARQMMLVALPMDKLIVTYCDCTDDASSANVAQELYNLGYDRDKIKVLSGGSLRWVALTSPLVSTK
jgi:rhodanese-related sulfurtransferase